VAKDEAAFADMLAKSPISTVMEEIEMPAARKLADGEASALPIVVAHGMGDSCFNSGMKSITKAAGVKVGAYSTCIPTGTSRIKDTINGFLLNMDASVDVFAEGVKADENLKDGFNAFGLSQGNNLIRGYIQK
jgi:palmitoyl-protein thioesterase